MERYAPIHPEHPLRRAALAILAALCVHAVLLLLGRAWERTAIAASRAALAAQPKEVTLARVDPAQWERNRSVAQTFVPSAAFDTPAAELAKPERARFLSDRDRRTERETVAAPKPGAPGRPAQASPATPIPEPAQAAQPAKKAGGEGPVAMASGATGDALAPGEGMAPRGGPALPDLQARPQQPQPQAAKPLVMSFDVAGEGGVPDIDGVAVGNLTVLNAEAWRYATFFDRVGSTLYGVWRVDFLPRPPVPSVAARPRGGSVRIAYGVTLDAAGRAVEVTVRRSSGFRDVDDLLAELIRKSAPFPNMPPGLLDASGRYSDIWVIGLVWGWRQQ